MFMSSHGTGEGIEKQLEDSLDAAEKVASQRNLGSKVQKALLFGVAHDTCGAKDKCVHHKKGACNKIKLVNNCVNWRRKQVLEFKSAQY
eukprot:346131-Pelagomonas_calceolata.AAC.1